MLATLETNTTPNDILAFGAGTRLKGTASCTAVALETRFGTLKTSLDKIVAVAGERDHSGKAIVLFRDGQALAGKLKLENFVFTLNTGLQIDATGDRLDRLYMRASEGTAGTAGEKPILLQTSDGERLALAPTGKEKMALVSPWGRFEFPLDNLVRVASVAEPPGHRIVLRDGTRLFGYLDAGDAAAGDAELRPIGALRRWICTSFAARTRRKAKMPHGPVTGPRRRPRLNFWARTC